jgi:CBS domain-containing protein
MEARMLAAAEPVARTEIDALRRFAPFDHFDEAAFEHLARHLIVATYDPGTILLQPGTEAQRLCIVAHGTVQSEQVRLDDLAEEPYPILGPGDCFPIAALFSHSAVTGIYRAAEPTRCFELAERELPELLRRAPAFERLCVARITAMLRQARARLHAQFTHVGAEQQSLASPLRAIVHGAPLVCAPDTPIREALRRMRQARVGSIVIAAAGGEPAGIFTQQDLLDRATVDGVDLAAPIETVMTPRPLTLAADATVYDASLAMARHGIRHAPVIEEGRMIGVVSQRDLFSVQRVTLRQLPETIAAAQDEAAIAHAAQDIRQLTKDMLVNGVAAEQLTQFIAALNDRLTQRVLELELPRHALGDLRFCWIALGSEGRLEQTFATDQDNGLIFALPEGAAPQEAREQLLPFAAAVNRTLDRCGFPLCKGDIMAGNRRWCLSLAEWQEQFSAWIRNTDPEAVLHSAIFFDFRPVFGDAALAERLRAWLLPRTQATPRFLLQMAHGALATRPPLGLFRDFRFDHATGFPHTIDLKLYGLRPFVEAARINALRFGIAHTNTAQRLRLAAASLHVDAGDMRGIVDAFYFIQLLRLRRQQFDPDAQRAPNRVDPDRLNPFDRRILKESFRQARELQQGLALDFPQ